jgi:very-short-patch-repair endonuclease
MTARISIARRLRRNQTEAERKLWFRLRDRRLSRLKFRRQVEVDRYVVDFLCADAKLIVEIDGGQHAIATEADAERTKVLETAGYLVLRFWNHDVLQNADGVVEAILDTLTPSVPHPDPLPEGERETPPQRRM